MKTGKKLLTSMILVLFIVFCRRMRQSGKNRCRCTAGGAEQRHGDSMEIPR